jgi:UDP-N-acetylmuramoyl-tripeptide--D-alanyl-D-alanine ligase
MAVLPFDSKYLDYMKDRCKCRFITFSVENSQADIYATKIWRKDKYLKASVEYDNEKFRIQTELLGEHTIYNLLPAIALASEIGVSKKSIESAIAEIKPVYGKLSVHEGVNDTTLINDGYSSNEQGFKAALDVLRGFEADQKLILSKGILELGEEKDSAYKRISRKFDECDCKLITNDSLFNKYVEDEKVVLVGSENEIFEVFDELSRKNDDTVVLVEGRFSPKFMSGLKISKKERA